jgi:AcrR family transcriptional regulator
VPSGGDGDAQRPGDLGPLQGGAHGLTRQEVLESQRERLLAATAELIAERGYAAVPILDIVRRASVANRIFYKNFKTKEEAFLAAFDAVADHLTALIREATRSLEDWPRQVIAALSVTIDFFESEPVLARFCLVAPFTAPAEAVAAHCNERIAAAAPFLAAGRELDGEDVLPPGTENSLLGGVVSQLSRAVLGGGSMTALLPDLVEFMLVPYLGADEARRLAEAV